MQRQSTNSLDLLSLFKHPTISLAILRHLVPEDILAVRATNRALRDNPALRSDVLWQEKLEKHISSYRRKKLYKSLPWHEQFKQEYIEEYRDLGAHERKLFSLLHEGDSASVIKLLQFSDMGKFASASVADMISRVGNRELLDHAFALVVKTQRRYPANAGNHPFFADFFDHRKYPWNYSFLHWAIVLKQPLAVIKHLLDTGCNTEAKDQWGRTALAAAISYDRADVIDLLLKCGANLHALDRDGDNMAMSALTSNHLPLVERFLIDDADIESTNHNGRTALMLAAERGNIAMLEYLLGRGAKLNTIDKHGYSALVLAIKNGQVTMAKHLINKGILINNAVTNTKYYDALIHAIDGSQDEIVDLLLSHDADIHYVDDFDGDNALLMAARCDNINLVMRLLDLGADIHHKNKFGGGLLDISARHGHMDLVKRVLDSGENMNALTMAFRSAVDAGKIEIAELLLTRGVNIDARGSSGETALHAVIQTGNVGMLKMLLEHGANPNVQCGYYRETPLMSAVSGGSYVCMQMLLNAGADITLQNARGQNALMLAVAGRYPKSSNLIQRQLIRHYITQRSAPDAPIYKNEISFFGFRHTFGYSQQQKIDAATAMIKFLEGGMKEIPQVHAGALSQGGLGEICKNIRLSPK